MNATCVYPPSHGAHSKLFAIVFFYSLIYLEFFHLVSVRVNLNATEFIFSFSLCVLHLELCSHSEKIGRNNLSYIFFFFQYCIDILIASMLWKNLMTIFLLICFLVLSCACAWWSFFQIIFTFLFCFSFLFLICLNSCFFPTPQPLLIDAYSPRPIPVLCLWKLQRMTNQEVWKKSLGKNENKMMYFIVSTLSSSVL